ncbi:MAG: sensor histidine kinase [Candidatus Hodarchaeota archaeon]
MAIKINNKKDPYLESDPNYRNFFAESPISLWRGDLSKLKEYLELLKDKVDDFRVYFNENPLEVKKCAEFVNSFSVNQTLVKFFEADSELELFGPLANHISNHKSSSGLFNLFKDSVIELIMGNRHIIVEGYSSTVKGKKIYIQIRTYIPEMFSSTWEEAVVMVIDLTEKKNLELRLRKMAENYEFLIDLITHDLRNYHHQSQAYLDIILDGYIEYNNDLITQSLHKSRKGLIEGTNLLKNVSVLMKTHLTEQNNLQPILLKKVLVKVKESIINLYHDQNIKISLEKVPENLMVIADSLIEHVFINLFTNAVKNDQNAVKRIKVTVFPKDDLCTISVIDYGIGIPIKKREQLFIRYSEFKREAKGSGLGMFIVKTLVDRYNGEIAIESRIKDDYAKGTRFNIILHCKSN